MLTSENLTHPHCCMGFCYINKVHLSSLKHRRQIRPRVEIYSSYMMGISASIILFSRPLCVFGSSQNLKKRGDRIKVEVRKGTISALIGLRRDSPELIRPRLKINLVGLVLSCLLFAGLRVPKGRPETGLDHGPRGVFMGLHDLNVLARGQSKLNKLLWAWPFLKRNWQETVSHNG